MKIILMFITIAMLSGCSVMNPKTLHSELQSDTVMEVSENVSEPELTLIPFSGESKSEGMTEVKSVPCDLFGGNDKITLYTSASKEEGEFVWDDGVEFLLEVKNYDGDIYTLFDGRVSLGGVYFDVVMFDENTYVIVRNISTASDYSEVFTVKDGELYKTDEIDLNNTKEYDTNLIYTSVPEYR
jgi:hypothetical protein